MSLKKKITLFLSFVFLLNMQAQTNDKNINITFSDIPLSEAIKKIESISKYTFFYDAQKIDLKQKVSLKANNMTIQQSVTQLLFNSNIKFEIKNLQIALYLKEVKQSSVLSKKITGLVTDEKGEPIIGATVVEKKSKSATITDMNGNFSLNVPLNSALTVSYIGYIPYNFIVGDQNNIKIQLVESTKSLDEVVVMGYGTLKKRDLTGSVVKVDMGDISKANVRSFDEALAGRVAGVQVSSTDGQPGAQVNIVIRGNNSITQDNSPLYVIDGFPIEGFNNNLLSPTEIESIEVLKDASATAIYGARGANGVIMITTIKGKEGPPIFTYDFSYGTQEKTNKIALLTPYQFVNLQQEVFGLQRFTDMYLTPKNRIIEDYKNIAPIDFEGMLTRVAPMSSHSISITGGSKQTKFSISGSITNQDGILIASNYKRYQGRLSVDQNVNSALKVGLSMSYSSVLQSGTAPSSTYSAATSNLMYQAWGYRPVTASDVNLAEVLYDPDIPTTSNYIVNPLQTAINEFRLNITNNITINAYAEYQLNKHFKIKTTGGINNSILTMEAFNNSLTNSGGPNSVFKQGINGGLGTRTTNNWLNENILSYSNLNKINEINVIAGITEAGTENRYYAFSANQIPNEGLGMNGLREGVPQNIGFSTSQSTLASFLTRINYSYKSKYLLTASLRADGSSRFATGNKWSYFPSGSIAWRLSSEDFMKKLEFVTDAKVRLSYGLTGNNRVGDFSYLSQLSSPISSIYPFDNNPSNIGSIVTALGNNDLRWETTSQTNVGIDLSMIKNSRITLSVDLYKKVTRDLLLNAQLPGSIGFTSVYKNIGKVQNQGLEFSLRTVNIATKNFTWTTSFNIAFNQSKVLQLTQDQQALPVSVRWEQNYSNMTPYIAKLNEPLSSFYGLVSEGVYQYSDFNIQTGNIGIKYVLKDDVPTNGNPASAIQPGDVKYRDLNGDKLIDSRDYTIIGNGLPIHIGGFTNNIQYKNFDMNVFFQWSYGNQVINANRYTFESGYRQNLNQYATYANRWSPTNQNTDIPRYATPTNYQYSSRVVEDASYLRLKTVSLGYNFPEKFLKQLKFRAIRVAISGQNLITWTKYSGLDPEVSVRNGALTQGFDFSPYPRARTINFNLKVQF